MTTTHRIHGIDSDSVPIGWRTPRYVVSPFTRGGNVFTEPADHNSDIMFVEQWAAAHGYKGVYSEEMTPWRRAHMSNLVNALDFANVSRVFACSSPFLLCYGEILRKCSDEC
jgi:phospholipase C